ncbi:MAG: hypothetical protein Q7R98_01105 [Candidatus Jorgensenbacteria bacterium]|nr:hypothetical protein [Candidatus Jorgensenbacteria bacterium]
MKTLSVPFEGILGSVSRPGTRTGVTKEWLRNHKDSICIFTKSALISMMCLTPTPINWLFLSTLVTWEIYGIVGPFTRDEDDARPWTKERLWDIIMDETA